MKHGPICEDDLHAWADGRLDAARRAEVESWLAEEPGRLARVAGWRAASASLHAGYDGILREPIPARLRAVLEARPRRAALRVAAVAAWVALGALAGAGAGYQYGRVVSPAPHAGVDFAREAAIAHAVFVPEVRHPVEVAAEEEAHLVAWLTKRLGAPVRIPDLGAHGFALLGGRLLPAAQGPGAQFMYEDTGGRRVTLYVSVREPEAPTTAFRYEERDGVAVFYWVDRRFGYALSAGFGRDVLLPLANAVYHQISP